MTNVQSIVVAALAATLLACAGPSVNYDYSAGNRISTYRTFAWRSPQPAYPASAGGFDNNIMNERVKRAVEGELGAKGFTEEEVGGNPDFFVIYHPQSEGTRSRQVGLGLGVRMGFLGLGLAAPVGDPQREAVAGIVLEVEDSRSLALVWKATAVGALQGSDSPEQADSDVKLAVHDMFKRFPPP